MRPDGSGDYPTIQEAIDAATDGDVVELTDGWYRGEFNRELDYRGKAITLRSQSGSAQSCILDSESHIAPHRAMVFHTGEGPGSVVEEITFTNGRAPDACGDNSGGAISLKSSTNPRILGCVFVANRAAFGGAVGCDSACTAQFENCAFISNVAETFGGAVVCRYDASPSFIGCTFRGNSTSGSGGAVCGSNSLNLSCVDCTFEENHAGGAGGAVSLVNWTPATLTRCAFIRNEASLGGAVSLETGVSAGIDGCTFRGNEGSFAGGVFLWGSEAIVTGCTFYENRSGSNQGAGLGSWPGSAVELRHSIIAFSGDGCAVRCGDGSTARLVCCDLFGNDDGDWVECVAGQLGVDGNIAEDPLFCDGASGNLRLLPESPCAPAFNPECGLIGAWPAGCDPMAMPEATGGGAVATAELEVPAIVRGGTRLLYAIPPERDGADASLSLHDATGRLVAVLVQGAAAAGRSSFAWDGTGASATAVAQGVYFFSLRVGDLRITRKAVILR